MTTRPKPAPSPPGGDEVPLYAGVELASRWLRLGSAIFEPLLAVMTLGIGWVIWALMIVGRGQTPAAYAANYQQDNPTTRSQ